MAWRVPTEDDIITRISSTELEAFRSVALKSGQADPVPAQITAIVDFIRSYLARSKFTNRTVDGLGTSGTIPERAMSPFLDLMVQAIQTRPAGSWLETSQGAPRQFGRTQAINWLEGVADNEIECDENSPVYDWNVPGGKGLFPPAAPTFQGPRHRRGGRHEEGL